MLKSFFKIAIRNLNRHKSFSVINIAGLSLGLSACMLIGLFVWDETRYDRFIPEGDQVYRLTDEYTNTQGTEQLAVGSPMFAPTLRNDFPEVEQTARVMMLPQTKALFETGKVKLYEENGYFVDSTFLEVLPLSLLDGQPNHSLDDPSSILISAEMAQRYFGNTSPVGKQLLREKQPYQIKGVFKKNPKFHLQFDYLIPISAIGLSPERMQSWSWHQFYTYVKLKKGADVQLLEKKFQAAVKQKLVATNNEAPATEIPHFQPLKKIHLYSAGLKFDAAQRGNITYVKALTLIAVFLLLIACFNFINLATAKSLQRAREVGVRKAIGAGKVQLLVQYIGETMVIAFISIIISTSLAILLLPWLNQFTGKSISSQIFGNPLLWVLFLALGLLVGLLAGYYPALILARFDPARVLKSGVAGVNVQGKIPWLRHGLVVIQFSLSVLLIIGSIMVFKQVNYLHHKDLGFNKDQVLFFPMRGDQLFNNVPAFKNELLQSPGVESVSIGYGFPGDAVAGDEIIVNKNGQQVTQSATQLMVDFDYVRTLGLQVIAGRDFSKEMKTDADHAFIVNETAARQMGFGTPEKAIGQTLSWHPWDGNNKDSLKTGQIIGVVKDFNYKSLYDKMETAVLQIYPQAAWKVAVKLKTSGISNTIASVGKAWNKFAPDFPIEYQFLDQNFARMYKAEDRLKSLIWIFAGMAIFIGCLGLFGLATFAAERRRKEMGIRKVLGASIRSVVLLLSRDFLLLVLIALLIASPLAAYFMHGWLENFAFRTSMEWWIFGIAAILAIGIAFLTVSIQAIKSALANPVKSLRSE